MKQNLNEATGYRILRQEGGIPGTLFAQHRYSKEKYLSYLPNFLFFYCNQMEKMLFL